MREKIKILFVHPYLSSFVKSDLEILQRHFDAKAIQWTKTRDIKNMSRIIWHILGTDLSFIWFAGGHAAHVVFFSKLFRKKSIVVVGGYEVANVPEIGYGLMLSPKSARRVKYVLENADKVLAVSEFNKKEILKYTNSKDKNIELVYNDVDCNKFEPKEKKEDLIITVGYVTDLVMKRKGFETFVKSAQYLQDVKFVLIGKDVDDSINYLKSVAPENVKFIGFVSDEGLLRWYQKAKVYCQLSIYESFGMALAEAMACECVPVVTNRGALPEVIGDTGFYVPYGDPKATAEAIKKALNSNKGKEARERIKTMFPLEKREKELKEMINNIMLRM
jgi:glycosyltransferase involved in cell wall biosynthesis